MFNDRNLTLLDHHILLEPQRPSASEMLLVTANNQVPPTMVGLVIKSTAPDRFKPGAKVLFVPHGGTLLKVPEGQPERMMLPIDQILGLVED